MKLVRFKNLKVGDEGKIIRKIDKKIVNEFIKFSKDFNPIHTNDQKFKKTILKGKIVHGMIPASIISAVVGTKMPGPGSIWMEQTFRFLKPVRIGDELTVVSKLISKKKEHLHVRCRINIFNQNNELVIEGDGLHKILEP